MGNPIQEIETSRPTCPVALSKGEIQSKFSTFWAIGNLNILDAKLFGLFCSIRCPGKTILNTYDCMRLLRNSNIAVVSGFHSPIEKDCLDILLKGSQPIVVCPARGITRMRIPNIWKKPIDDGRMLILSPFDEKQKRPTVSTAQQRNHLVAMLGMSFLIPYADAGGKTERLGLEIIHAGKKVFTLSRGPSSWALAGAIKIEPTEKGIKNLTKNESGSGLHT